MGNPLRLRAPPLLSAAPRARLEVKVTPSPSPSPPPLTREEAAAPAEPSPKKAEPGEIRQPFFKGTGGALFGIQLVNTFLTIVTLGFYSFWAKTKVRNYLWSQTELEGDRFVYHGTGMELMSGFFKVMILIAVPLFLLELVPRFIGPSILPYRSSPSVLAVCRDHLIDSDGIGGGQALSPQRGPPGGGSVSPSGGRRRILWRSSWAGGF